MNNRFMWIWMDLVSKNSPYGMFFLAIRWPWDPTTAARPSLISHSVFAPIFQVIQLTKDLKVVHLGPPQKKTGD